MCINGGDRAIAEEIDAVEISVEVLALSPKAYRVRTVNYRQKSIVLWVPRRFVLETDCIAEGDVGTMLLAEGTARLLEIVQ